MESPLSRFSATVEDYRRYRPSYPSDLVDWILARGGVRRDSTRVLDLGCGTGITTRLFLERGLSVVALDPNAAMLARARRDVPAGRFVRGRAERTPLAGGSFGLAVCGQALHWFELDAALTELDRVLAPGGWAAAFWNVRTGQGITGPYAELLVRHSSEYARLPDSSSTLRALRAAVADRVLREAAFPHAQELDLEGLLGRARSSSYVAHGVADGAAFEDELRALFDRFERDGRVRFSYRTRVACWPARAGGGLTPPRRARRRG